MKLRTLPALVLVLLTPVAASAVDCFEEIDPVYWQADVEALLDFESPADLADARSALLHSIWVGYGRPTGSNVTVHEDVRSPVPAMGNLLRVDELVVSMGWGFTSHAFHFVPRRSSGRLVVHHAGHGGALYELPGASGDAIRFLVERGFPVIALDMPLYGLNEGPVSTHAQVGSLAGPALNPLKFFLEPTWLAIDAACAGRRCNDVAMMGLSGGGWTTTIYAAIDPRIRLSFPVAGSLPEYLRRPPCGAYDVGDWEQRETSWQSLASYPELYVMGASGLRREQVQVLNKYDPCCFSGLRFVTYEDHVAAAVQQLGPGRFSVHLDDTHRRHAVSPAALEDVIFGRLAVDDLDRDGVMDWAECPDPARCFDDERDGVPDRLESRTADLDADGLADEADPDDDGDGRPTTAECPGGGACPDADGDGVPDFRERADRDLDRDGLVDEQDADDDGDGFPTSRECPEPPWNCPAGAPDGTPDYLARTHLVDDREPGFEHVGTSWRPKGGGFGGDVAQSDGADPSSLARWTLDLPPGRYRISTTWPAHENRTDGAAYAVRSRDLVASGHVVDQRSLPWDYSDALGYWEILAADVEVGAEPVVVTLVEQGSGMLIADAVRADRVGALADGPSLRVALDADGAVRLQWDGEADAVNAYRGPLDLAGDVTRGRAPWERVQCGVAERSFRAAGQARGDGSWIYVVAPTSQGMEGGYGCGDSDGDGSCDVVHARSAEPCP